MLEEIARVGLAAWFEQSVQLWDQPTVLGTIGDEFYLVEIDAENRERALRELIDKYDVDAPNLRIEIAFFGDAGGFFASAVNFLEHWPKSAADVPVEVFIDNHYRATFTTSGDDIVISVRHALRPSGGPPKRQFRFGPKKYEQALADLTRESLRLRADLVVVAQQAPEKLASLEATFKHWPE